MASRSRFQQFVSFSSPAGPDYRCRMGMKKIVVLLLLLSLCFEGASAKEKGTKKGKKKGKQVYCPS